MLHNFAHCWKRTYNRQEAEVRIYATDLAYSRWLPHGPDEAFDPVNVLTVKNTPAELHEPKRAGTVCNGMWLRAEGENPRRVVMDFSPDLWLPDAAPGLLTLRGMDPSVLLGGHGAGDGVDWLNDRAHAPRCLTRWRLNQDLIPAALFHEFMHVYLLNDFAESGQSTTGGWEYCMLQKRGEAPICAEPLAMLSLWAALADMRPAGKPSGGFSLHRGWHEVPGAPYDVDGRATADDKTTYEPNLVDVLSAVQGELVFYEDLTS